MKNNLLKTTFENIHSINQKMTLLVFAIVFGNLLMAQLPENHFGVFEFHQASLNNTSYSGETSLTGTATATTDRFNNANDAITLTSALSGLNLGSTNVLSSTLSFWVKTDALIANKRVLQIIGTSSKGYRLAIGNNTIELNANAQSATNSFSNVTSGNYDLDDNQWHHIVVRTTGNATNNHLIIDLFIDGVSSTVNTTFASGASYDIFNFMDDANFKLDPLNSFEGSIDDIYLYKSSLTATEILQIYNYEQANRYYVDIDATGNNDGTSWADAFTDLQNAFNNASEGVEIWVAEGKYIRNVTTTRNVTFSWDVDSVKVYGGFTGNETMLSERNWETNRTIISGDLGTLGDNSDNSYSAFYGAAGSVNNVLEYGFIDGFVIQDGNANINNSGYGGAGAGYYMGDNAKKMEFHNCEFSNNNAKFGTAIYAKADTRDAELIFDACIITNNTARLGVGAAFYSNKNLDVKITNCLFSNNETLNISSLGGFGQSGVIYAYGSSNTDFNLDIINSTFANNENNGTYPNNVFGTILLNNTASSTGSKTLNVDNCIFWGNNNDTTAIATHFNTNEFDHIEVNNSISEHLPFPIIATTTNIINQDPLFTSSTDFTLQGNSPALNTGSLSGLSIPMYDLGGNERVNSSVVDLGCYEKECNLSAFSISESTGVLIVSTSFTTYQWYKDGTIISGANSISYTATANGDYYCEISNGTCTVSSNKIDYSATSGPNPNAINNLSFETLKVFPNPTTGIVNISVNETLQSIVLLDITGKQIKSFDSKAKQLDVSDVTTGIYFLEVANESKKSVVKLIVR